MLVGQRHGWDRGEQAGDDREKAFHESIVRAVLDNAFLST